VDFFLIVRNSKIHLFLVSFRYLKFVNFLMCASLQITNPQIFMNNLQIADPTKYCTTLSQNSPKSCKEKKYVFTDLSKFEIRKKAWAFKSSKRKSTNYESTNHKKIGFVFRSTAKCHNCGCSAKLSNYLKVPSHQIRLG
jgi:hypothetical protein